MEKIRSRLAPTPSGYLHFGNIFSFVFTWLYVKKNNGTLLLRIDDLDKARIRTAYIDDVFRTLDWLEIDYDEGPSGTEDFLKNHSQHTRLDLYHDTLTALKDNNHLFACTCSRAQIQELSPNGQYPGSCIHQNKDFDDKLTAWRLLHNEPFKVDFLDIIQGKVERDLSMNMRNPVLKRKDKLPAYQIASLADDIHYNINTIVRGADLLDSTALQIHLAKLTHKTAFTDATFLHHNLIKDTKQQKLSKSQDAPAIHLWQNKPDGKMKLLRKIAVLLNVDPIHIENMKDLLQHFNTPSNS